jgi:hypothetical protein
MSAEEAIRQTILKTLEDHLEEDDGATKIHSMGAHNVVIDYSYLDRLNFRKEVTYLVKIEATKL